MFANALSQAVPAIATGWSHKYQELLQEYGCPECLLDVRATQREIAEALYRLTHGPERESYVNRLRERAERQNELVNNMWQEVDRVLGIGK